jgi:hypothetical protein
MHTNQYKPSAPNPGNNAEAVALLPKQAQVGGKGMVVLIHDPWTRRGWLVSRYEYCCCSYMHITLHVNLYVPLF